MAGSKCNEFTSWPGGEMRYSAGKYSRRFCRLRVESEVTLSVRSSAWIQPSRATKNRIGILGIIVWYNGIYILGDLPVSQWNIAQE